MWLAFILLASAPGELRYLALGDSFTIGTGSSESQAFPSKLKAPLVQSFKPTLVSVAVGANDIVRGRAPDAYRANLKRLFAALPKGATVIALPQPDWSHTPVAKHFGDPDALQARIVHYNRILQEEATAAGAKYLDLWPLMRRQADAQELAPDGLHPSARAHAAWAQAIAEGL